MSMEITVEKHPSVLDFYDVTIGDKFFLTTLVVASDCDRLKEWIQGVQKMLRKDKKHDVVVGLCAMRGDNIAGSPGREPWELGSCKDDPYDLLQLCIGDHCLLYELSRYLGRLPLPKFFKDFLYGATVVGVGIEEIASKLEKEFGPMIPKRVDLRDLAYKCESGENSPEILNSFRRLNLGELAQVLLKGEVDVDAVKPKSMRWYAKGGLYRYLSDDMIKYSTLDAFLAFKIGEKLLSLKNI